MISRTSKFVFRSLLLISLILVSVTGIYLFNLLSFEEKQSYFKINSKNHSTTSLNIGIIGDSWVANNRLDKILKNELIQLGIKSEIISSGNHGAKSKRIYQNLFKDHTNQHSSKHIIEQRPDFCIVVSGVNDVVGQTGKEFYTHHNILIIELLLHYNIKPIILELPEVNITEATNRMPFLKRQRNILLSHLKNKSNLNNIHPYRNYFLEALKQKKLLDKVILVPFKNICEDYNKCTNLYSDPFHLSIKGNEKLCKVIASEISKSL